MCVSQNCRYHSLVTRGHLVSPPRSMHSKINPYDSISAKAVQNSILNPASQRKPPQPHIPTKYLYSALNQDNVPELES